MKDIKHECVCEEYANFPEISGKEIDMITPEINIKIQKYSKFKREINGQEEYKFFPENENELLPASPFKKSA